MTIDIIDSGIGIEAANGVITNCLTVPLYVFADCCFGITSRLQRRLSDGTYEEVWPQIACDCAGPAEPTEIEPSGVATFDATPWPTMDGGTFRWVFSVSTCEDFSCAEELYSPDFEYYWEG